MHPSTTVSSARLSPHSVSGLMEGSAHTIHPARPAGDARSAIGIIRQYLVSLSRAALEAEAMRNELAMRAMIILEYMSRYAITDVNQGIRQFTAFERQRLHQLGLVTPAKARVASAAL